MGWDMQSGICKRGFSSRPNQFLCWFGGAAETAPLRTLGRGCPELSLPIPVHLYSFIALISSPIYMLFSYHSGTHDYPRCHPDTLSIHCADLQTIRDRSQPRNAHSATHSHLCTTSLPTSTRPPSPSLHTFWSSPVTLLCHWECPLIE